MRKKVITYNSRHYQNTPKTNEVYGKNDQKIRQEKVVTTKRKVKTVDYGPANRVGKQTKTKTKVKR